MTSHPYVSGRNACWEQGRPPVPTQFFVLNYISQKSVRHSSLGGGRVGLHAGEVDHRASSSVYCRAVGLHFPEGPCTASSPESERSEVPAGRSLLRRGLSGLSVPPTRSRVDLKPCAPSRRPVGRGPRAVSGWPPGGEGTRAAAGRAARRAPRERRLDFEPGPAAPERSTGGAQGYRGPGTPGRGETPAPGL